MLNYNDREYDILTNFFVIALSLTIYNAVNKYKIYKQENKKITITTPSVIKSKFTKNDKKRLRTLKLNKEILNFIKTIKQNINEEDLNNLYNNLKTLRVNEKIILPKNLLLIPVGGYYKPKKNKISVLKLFKKDIINHELLHMASSCYDEKRDITYVGFAQINYKNKTVIGRGLTEGYTETLNSRYFNHNNYSAHSYKVCNFFANMLELIVEKNVMEKAYFNANLPMLILELEKYDTKENIIKFIKAIDNYLIYNNYKNKLFLFPSTKILVNKKINENLKIIQNSLIKWYKIKIDILYKNNKISKELYKTRNDLYPILVTKDKLLKKYKLQ